MKDIWKIVGFIFMLGAAMFLSATRLLSVGGIAPDLVLLLFLLLFFRTAIGRRLSLREEIFLVLVFVALTFVVWPFWMLPAVLLAAVVLGIYLFARKVTGDAFWDFSLSLFFGTLVFYALSTLVLSRSFPPFSIGGDFLLTFAWGVILWFPVGYLSRILEP